MSKTVRTARRAESWGVHKYSKQAVSPKPRQPVVGVVDDENVIIPESAMLVYEMMGLGDAPLDGASFADWYETYTSGMDRAREMSGLVERARQYALDSRFLSENSGENWWTNLSPRPLVDEFRREGYDIEDVLLAIAQVWPEDALMRSMVRSPEARKKLHNCLAWGEFARHLERGSRVVDGKLAVRYRHVNKFLGVPSAGRLVYRLANMLGYYVVNDRDEMPAGRNGEVIGR